ncbi:site-specific integrase [Mucilaginibacter terrenus]|uniref:Site-specific integrase n=1 Tax=Mucilaginibacter terrenus TaxID=2482727 RepID=A0A3E2NW98_9SPHI|nr:site-specific integrase [Mucilaginibacter terrenus]RFZ85272.1 site-specific integrase [Mucilaginibacter terrenus]
MLEKTFSLLVHLKKPKFHKGNDPYQIYLRITVDGISIEISAKRTWDPVRWSSRSGRAAGSKEDAKSLNLFLDLLTNKVHEARRTLIDANKEVTSLAIKNCLLGVDDNKCIIKEFNAHNQQIEALVPSEYSPGTLDLFERTLLHAQRFIKWKYNLDDLEIKKLDYDFISQFSFYLKSERKCQHNTTIKYLTYFKKIVLLCVKRRWLKQDPFSEFSLAKRYVPRPYLTENELHTIAEKTFSTERLSVVRDIFLFSCYTGLAYADVQKLKRTEIIIGFDGEEWIDTIRQKTDSTSKIPLLPLAQAMIRKYVNHPVCQIKGTVLPILSNQKMNAYLKEIADTCSIDKNLTFHIARHTFATTVTLSNGVPIESVSKMLGHQNLKQTQHYAKILDVKVSEDMMLLKRKMQSVMKS